MKMRNCIWLLLFFPAAVRGELTVLVRPPVVIGNKAVVALGLKNSFSQSVESARATLILLDEQGKMVGQSAKWVIGGTEDKPGLAAGGTNTFNVVITSAHPLTTTNLTASVQFNRVVLEGGKLADITKDVTFTSETK